ncbi:hypothetical protein FRC04_005228 [Tulasnella sp. 424]|nr:hypothetical protein FRC04_005228 [Tulasnella sp. 424]
MILEQVDGDPLFERFFGRVPEEGGTRSRNGWIFASRSNGSVKASGLRFTSHQPGLSHEEINSLNTFTTYPTAHSPNILKLIDFSRSTFHCAPNVPSHLPPSKVPSSAYHPFPGPKVFEVATHGWLCGAYTLGVLLWCLDKERLVEIDQAVERKEEIVLFDVKDQDDDEGADADDESSVEEDAGSSTPASNDPSSSQISLPNKKKLSLSQLRFPNEDYLSGITTTRGILKVSVEAGGDSDRWTEETVVHEAD